jgi:hypothetical protein
MAFFTFSHAIDELQRSFEEKITLAVKSLLESKHLYQSITLEYSDILKAMLKRKIVHQEARKSIPERFSASVQANWFPIDRANPNYILPYGNRPSPICFNTPDVKLFCNMCERVEPANSVSSADFFWRNPVPEHFALSGQKVQVFVFSFLCQSCKSAPEVFLVRRQGLKLIHSGRSPIEHIDVPRAIPKPVKSYYSGAVVAHQSGQTLAGIFLLRTVIEQWARSIVRSTLPDAEKLLDAYMSTLPEDFKQRFPSFHKLYADLSDDLHAAKGDAGLFQKALAEIDQHFDARRIFNL